MTAISSPARARRALRPLAVTLGALALGGLGAAAWAQQGGAPASVPLVIGQGAGGNSSAKPGRFTERK